MATNKISYLSRDFNSIRTDLINYIKIAYPDLISDFSDASISMLLLELNAAVSDMLSFNTDAAFQETQLENVQQRKNILALAKTLGLNIPSKKASISIVDFSITIPPFGDSFDTNYCGTLQAGSQAIGSSKVFENLTDIDFSSAYGFGGNPNRLVVPNIDSNDIIRSYTITKRELVTNGVTKVFSKVIDAQNFKPFMEVILPDSDVLSIEQVIVLDGTNFTTNPATTDFFNYDDTNWYEVPHLAEQKIFIQDASVTPTAGIVGGKYINVSQKFIKEFTSNGFCKLTFGGGVNSGELFDNYLNSIGITLPIGDFINNDSLGVIPPAGSTMFVRYRVGGGASSNIGANVLTQIGNANLIVNGPNDSFNAQVKASLKCNNPIPALGGKDAPSIEEIRNLATYNFGSQERAVTVRDYLTRVSLMPGQFGIPFRTSAHESQNKIIISILALDSDGKLQNTSTNILKDNIAEYLSYYRMFNDFVEIQDGKIINIGVEADILIDKHFSQAEIGSLVISTIANYFDIANHEMNENIYLSDLIEKINNVNGVVNVIDLRIVAKVGGNYSTNESSQEYSNSTTKEFALVDNTLFGEMDGQFEIKFPNKDIVLRMK